MNLDFDRESTSCHLILPFFDPGIWADFIVCLLEILAWLVVGSAQFLATIEVQKHLVAIARLVCVREPWIERGRGEILSGDFTWIDFCSGHFEWSPCVKCYLKERERDNID